MVKNSFKNGYALLGVVSMLCNVRNIEILYIIVFPSKPEYFNSSFQLETRIFQLDTRTCQFETRIFQLDI